MCTPVSSCVWLIIANRRCHICLSILSLHLLLAILQLLSTTCLTAPLLTWADGTFRFNAGQEADMATRFPAVGDEVAAWLEKGSTLLFLSWFCVNLMDAKLGRVLMTFGPFCGQITSTSVDVDFQCPKKKHKLTSFKVLHLTNGKENWWKASWLLA